MNVTNIKDTGIDEQIHSKRRESYIPVTILNGLQGVGNNSQGGSDKYSLNRSLTSIAPTMS